MFKLTYFDLAGYCEPVRHLFALAKVDFEDDRIPRDEYFPVLRTDIKEKAPWGQVPLLYQNGELILAQSSAILRFLARKFGFVGSSELEAAKCDELVDATKDFTDQWRAIMKEKELAKKKEIFEGVKTVAYKVFLERIEKILANNKDGWLVGSKLTWADLYVIHFIKMFEHLFAVSVKIDYKNICKLWDRIYNLPEIKAWNEKHPFTNPTIKEFILDW